MLKPTLKCNNENKSKQVNSIKYTKLSPSKAKTRFTNNAHRLGDFARNLSNMGFP